MKKWKFNGINAKDDTVTYKGEYPLGRVRVVFDKCMRSITITDEYVSATRTRKYTEVTLDPEDMEYILALSKKIFKNCLVEKSENDEYEDADDEEENLLD